MIGCFSPYPTHFIRDSKISFLTKYDLTLLALLSDKIIFALLSPILSVCPAISILILISF